MENTMNITPMEQPRNPHQKMPVILLLDTSGSMDGEGIKDLNHGIALLKNEILNNPHLQGRIELGIISFNDTAKVERCLDLVTVDTTMPSLTAGGQTNTVAGISAALAEISARKQFYRKNHEQHYRPLLLLMTDGRSSNSSEEVAAIRSTLQEGMDKKQFMFKPVAVGDAADAAELARMSPSTTDERLKKTVVVTKLNDTTAFGEFFLFLSASIGTAAAGRTGVAEVTLEPEIGHTMTFALN